MTVKYHISPTTGNPNRCYAEKRPCPLGGEAEHYGSKEDARAAYEAQHTAAAQAHRKAPAQGTSFASEDSLLPGMGRASSGAKSQARVEAYPQLAFEDVRDEAGDWVTEVHANGETAFTVATRKEAETAARARETGQWQPLREAMQAEPASCEEVDDLLTYQADELDEELEAREDTLASTRRDVQNPREYDAAFHDVEVARIALAIHTAEEKAAAKRTGHAAASLETTMVREPGVPPYEEVKTSDGRALGTVMFREGFHIAAVHNGRAPRNVGQYESREEALAALAKNNGEGQKQ